MPGQFANSPDDKYHDSHGEERINNVFVFNPDSLSIEYHLVIINKPGIPLTADEKSLNADMTYSDSTGKFPKKYIEHNLPDYYVDRDIAVIKLLQTQDWVSGNKLVVAGHSEGSTNCCKACVQFSRSNPAYLFRWQSLRPYCKYD